MAGALVTTVSNALKYRYLGQMQTQLNNEILVDQILDLDSKRVDLDGLKAKLAIHYGRNTGVGARREDEDLPAAGNQAYQSLEFDLAYMYGRARFSGQAIQKTKSDAGAFVRVVTDELDRLRDDLALDMARQYYGSTVGVAGAIARVSSVSGTDLVLTSDEALQKGFIHLGMKIDVGSSAILPRDAADSITVDDIDIATSTITVSSAGTIATNDYIFREDNNDASGTKEIDAGLQDLISTSANTVGGLDASSNSHWDNARDTAGGAISLSNLMKNSNVIHARGAKASEIVTLTTPGLSRRLFETADFSDAVRFVEPMQLKGGFEGISFAAGSGRYSLVMDRLAPYGKVFFVHKKHIKVFSPGDWAFLSRDGLTIRWVDSRDAFQAVLWRYVNLGTDRRNTSLVMSGLTDTGF
jgi:hypothetical protein